ncbi:MAG: hypothetical protein ACTSO3_01015 [Candidatus Heimdallarchaeaceae archaeon]
MEWKDKLKNCPLCNEPAHVPRIGSLEKTHCTDMDCSLHTVFIDCEEWNTRPIESKIKEIVEIWKREGIVQTSDGTIEDVVLKIINGEKLKREYK